MFGAATLGHVYRRKRNALLRTMRAPVVRHVYRLRGGWQTKLGIHVARIANSIRPSSVMVTAQLHFLYVLNRHDALSQLAWLVVLGDVRYRGNQLVLHMLLKAAWILQDEALLEIVMDLLKRTQMSHNNMVFIAMRKSAHPTFGFNTIHMASHAKTALYGLDLMHQAGRTAFTAHVQILDTTESFELPPALLCKLETLEDEATVLRFLARRAVRYEDWHTAWDKFDLARQATPTDPRNYIDLGDTALYFSNPLERIQKILADRVEAGVVINGYDKLQGLKHLLNMDYCAYLRLRDTQVSNLAAHQEYGSAVSQSMGERATALTPFGQSAFVIGRDGVSDELRWSYYYEALSNSFQHVGISCDPRLKAIFERSYPRITFYPVARNWGRAQTRVHDIPRDKVSNMELASRLDNKAFAVSKRADQVMYIEDVPLRDWVTRGLSGPPASGEPRGATLQPAPDRAAYWRDRLTREADGKLTVGLIWRSGLVDLDRQRHYLQLADFISLMDMPVVFYAIQHQVTDSERADATKMGIRFVDDQVDFYDDFEEIAAMTAALDLVIGISTLPYELAAAVGTECWLCAISPLGRWMRLGQQGTTFDRLTRNGRVFYPKLDDGYLGGRHDRIGSIIGQITKELQILISS